MKKLYFLVVLAISFATQAQIVNIPDANFKAKLLSANSSNQIASTETPDSNGYVTSYNSIDINNDGEIQVSEAALIKYLDISHSSIADLAGIEKFINLNILKCSGNNLSTLDVSYNYYLNELICSNSSLTTLNISNNPNLINLFCDQNQLTYIDFSSAINIKQIICFNNFINSLNLNNNLFLHTLDCSTNQMSSLNIDNITTFIYLKCSNNLLTSLNINNNNPLLNTLICYSNQITSLSISNANYINTIDCSNNNISNLQLHNISSLNHLDFSSNNLVNVDLTGLSNSTGVSNLRALNCSNNYLSNLNINNLKSLESLSCFNNQLVNLNVSNLVKLNHLSCSNNQLNSLNIKNGKYESTLNFSFNPNLQYICCDDSQFNIVQAMIIQNSQMAFVNSYCSFIPGGVFYEINGNTKLDYDINGCDSADLNIPNLYFTITDGTTSGVLISNTIGNYSIQVQAGTHTITPVLENSTFFNISPTSIVANFPTQTSPLIQDFCVTANEVYHDVEVIIVPTNPARPGFDANYTIIYKNKGNQVESGTITLDFNDAILDLVSANPIFFNQETNSLIWNYANLQPFEVRTIDFVFNLNSPMEIPAVNNGDVLGFSVDITPILTDNFTIDNHSELKQTVLGSYDPNDKTCIEGTTVGPDMIGQYVHYVIRFENTGTFAAENVVIKDIIDLTKFDVSTLIPMHSSHDFVTRINGNKVEFIFEGINLPFDDANNDGYLVFKIKTESNLVISDIFTNSASIYFDYNFPIITNLFSTTITDSRFNDFDLETFFTFYPNPVKDVLNFQSKGNMTINSIEIYNTLGQIVLAVPNAISSVDVSSLQSGNYFVKVNTNLGVSNTKFIKE